MNDKVAGRIHFVMVQEYTPGVFGLFDAEGELMQQAVAESTWELKFDMYYDAAMQAQMLRYRDLIADGLANKIRRMAPTEPGSMWRPELDFDQELQAFIDEDKARDFREEPPLIELPEIDEAELASILNDKEEPE